MTCEECEQRLLESKHATRVEGGMARISSAALVEAHVQHCPTCATKITELARVEDALSQLRLSTMHVQASATVERNLLDAFRRRAASQYSSAGRAFACRLAWVSAVLLLLSVAGVLFHSSLRDHFSLGSENNGYSHKVGSQPPSSAGSSGVAAEVFEENRASTNIATISRRHAAEHRNSRRPVVLETPIAPSDELSLNGGGSIVRVTLPFSSLTAMGLLVRPDLSETRVTADVWVDPFGAVVGIRLVPAKTNVD